MTFWTWFFVITTVTLSIGFLIILFNSSDIIKGLKEVEDTQSALIAAQQKQMSTLKRRCIDMAREIHALTYTTGHPETIQNILRRYEKSSEGYDLPLTRHHRDSSPQTPFCAYNL